MRTNILFCYRIFLGLALVVFSASGQTTFDKNFLLSAINCQMVVASSEGGVYVIGETIQRDVLIMKLDSAGNLLWAKSIGSPIRNEHVYDALLTTNNKLLIAASADAGAFSSFAQGLIICADSAGNFLYTKTFGNDINQVHNVNTACSDSSGYTFAVHYSDSVDSYLKVMQFSLDGQLINEKRLSASFTSNIFKRNGGGYLLSSPGNTIFTPLSSNLSGTSMIITNTNVNKIYKIKQFTSGNDFLFVGTSGDAAIGHINSSYQCDWVKMYGFSLTTGCNLSFIDFQKMNDGSYMILGYSPFCAGPFLGYYVLVHTDSAFNVLRSRIINFGYQFDELLSKGTATLAGNDMVFCANYFVIPTSGILVSVIRTDTALTGMCHMVDTSLYTVTTVPFIHSTIPVTEQPCTTLTDTTILTIYTLSPVYGDCNIITTVENETDHDNTLSETSNAAENDFFLFPNPVSTELNFSFPEAENYFLTIKNTLSETILIKSVSEKQFSVDVKDFPSGIYFVTVQDEKNNLVTIKFVKM